MPRPRPIRSADPAKLIPDVISAVISGPQTLRQATRPLAEHQRDALSRALRMDVDEWRAEFARQLRATGSQILQLIQEKAQDIKPDALAYTLAVMADKANALDGRSQLNGASVNIQVNNYGQTPRTSLLADLDGLSLSVAPAARPSQPGAALAHDLPSAAVVPSAKEA